MFRVHCQLEHNLQSPEERAYTRESRPDCPAGRLWEIVSIMLIQVGRPPTVGGTIPLVSFLDCVNVERGLHKIDTHGFILFLLLTVGVM